MNTSHVQRREVLARVLGSRESSFYRAKYAGHPAAQDFLRGQASWETIPFLTRAELQGSAFFDRLFVPKKDVEAIRVTSGTSGTGVIIMPRMGKRGIPHVYFRPLSIHRLATFSGGQFIYEDNFRKREGVTSFHLTSGNARLAASLLALYKPDMLAGFPYAIVALVPELQRRGCLSSIRIIQLFGERCTYLQWEYLHAHFPDVPIFVEYASIEAQITIGEACWHIAKSKQPYIHPIPEHVYLEVVDFDTGHLVNDEWGRGEVVITVLRPVGLPLIRYRTGDMGVIVRRRCECGNLEPVLQIEGRIDVDRIRVDGGEINVAEIDRVLAQSYAQLSHHDFEARVGEVVEAGRIRSRLTIRCGFDAARVSTEELATRIERTLRISPMQTYADRVLSGDFMQLAVENLGEIPTEEKRRRLIRV